MPPTTNAPKNTIFLLPQFENMHTARFVAGKIELLHETVITIGCKYVISDRGWVAFSERDSKFTQYGKINDQGEIEGLNRVYHNDKVVPKALGIVGYNLLLGGDTYEWIAEESKSVRREMVVCFSMLSGKMTRLENPFKEQKKSVDDFLVDGDKIWAVDNVYFPKYMLEYDFSLPDQPKLSKVRRLPNNGTNESIKLGTKNEKYTALLSKTSHSMGTGMMINIFKNGNFEDYLKLAEHKNDFDDKKDETEAGDWNDIVFLPGRDILLISDKKRGVGLCRFDPELIGANPPEKGPEIQYVSADGFGIEKIVLVPNQPDYVVLILSVWCIQDYESIYELIPVSAIFKAVREKYGD